MKYNFDKVIDRSGTSAEKVEGLKHIWGRTDLIPLWVADMDFATAPFVTDAIRKRCENEVLGYTGKPDSYYNAIINWVKQRYDLIVTKEVINFVPGIVPGIGMAMNCFTQKGDKVMIQPPVYHPFAWVTTRNERTLVINPLKWENGMYRMDLDAFREQIKAGTTTTINQITGRMLDSIMIPLPPVDVQNQFATFAERVDQQKQTVQQSLEKLELLKKALMQEYFG